MNGSETMQSDKVEVEPDPFEAVVYRHRSGSHGAGFRLRILSIVILLLGLCTIAVPFALQYMSSLKQAELANRSDHGVDDWHYPKAKEALEAADRYNKDMALMGQPIMGEAMDPFNGGQTDGQSRAEQDERYQSLLDQGEGIMGSIIIPKISVHLPIYHGTSERVLASGAGHLYGSSLPVGGPSTHAVVTGHRGLVNAPMFTRLDELERGDTFYIRTMGKTLGYQVDQISVIDPNDTSRLKIVPGQDRVTLMTCTPYGVNTHRLLVSGHRAKMPEPIPFPEDARKDARMIIILTLALMLLMFLVLALTRSRHVIMRHAAGITDPSTGQLIRPKKPSKRRENA